MEVVVKEEEEEEEEGRIKNKVQSGKRQVKRKLTFFHVKNEGRKEGPPVSEDSLIALENKKKKDEEDEEE
ncbi:hypothetical protein M0804_007499 [Polistes exclamans]|nr:hypothetical protein M0804_007499 [Polistes exclamans]